MPVLCLLVSYTGIAGVVSDLSLHIAPAPSRALVELARHSLCMGGALKAELPQINAVPRKQGWTPSVSWTKNKNLSSGKSITRVSQQSLCKCPVLRKKINEENLDFLKEVIYYLIIYF